MSGDGPMISANRLVRTRMPGGVEAGGRNPPGYTIRFLRSVKQL